jgi:outer membrane protein assembly factor BamB/TolB-like protein
MPRYKLQDQIGRGSWSVVYKAVDSMNGDVVAVKQLTGEAGIPKRELAISRRVTHRNVCRIFDYFLDDSGANCISMEYVDGGSLRSVIEQNPGGLRVEKCLSIAGQILDGLEAAHQLKIVHRDLKPENILLTSDGTVKVSDFGQARAAGTPQSVESLREAGTPAYMAPEQSMANECDARADIFAFGIILHELFTGKRPELLSALSLPAEVPAHVQPAIRKCLEIDPARRFASVSDVRKALTGKTAPRMTAVLVIALVVVLGVGALVRERSRTENPYLDVASKMPINPAAIKPEPPLFPTGPKTIQRVAVLDFENLTGDKALDPYTVGISETLSTELAQVRGLTVVDRNRVRETSRERTTSDQGRLIGADTLITGSFQKLDDKVRLTARIFDVDSGADVREPALVDGAFKDLFKLQAELAKQLGAAIQGASTEVSATGVSADAFRTFSDGLYFLRSDLTADALKQFDLTLKIDPNYPGAQHYRGVALAKLNRLDEAINAFKRALPRSEPHRLVLWSWDAPPTGSQHGFVRAIDTGRAHLQKDFFEGQQLIRLQKQLVYGERSGKGTVLQFLDLERRDARRLEVADTKLILDTVSVGNDSVTILPSADRTLSAFAKDGSLLWHIDLADYGADPASYAFIGNAFYIYSAPLMRFDLFDARTGSRLWRKEGFRLNGIESPMAAHTKADGDILIVKSQDIYRAIRKSDGKDVWTVGVQSQKASELINDRMLIVFEPERRIFSLDLETGKTVAEASIPQYAAGLPRAGTTWLVGAVLDGNTVYVLSNDSQLCAVDVRNGRVRWKTPLQGRFQRLRVWRNHIYAGMESGEVIVIDAASGAITTTTKLTNRPVLIDYAGDNFVFARSDNTLFCLSPSGVKKWEHAPADPNHEATYFNGTILIYTSALQISALEAETGKTLWQVAGTKTPWLYTSADRLFVLDDVGVKEYATGGAKQGGVTEKETLTELGRAYLAKKDLKSAPAFVEKALELDPNDPGATLVRARLFQAQGRAAEAGRQLARYASLVGLDSKEGQRTVGEMKREHGLVWESATGWSVAGEPMIVGDRLVSVGRADPSTHESSIVGLNRQSGAVVWRYNEERFAASAIGTGGVLWYVAGAQADAASVALYRVDARTGERKQVANWRVPERVDQAWIAPVAKRIFVAETSSDVKTGMLRVDIECRDAASGTSLWMKGQNLKVSARDLGNPIQFFAADGDAVTYAIGKETWTLRAGDGAVLTAVRVPKATRAPVPPMSLWPSSSFRMQDGRLYAFTADGRAYAMQE